MISVAKIIQTAGKCTSKATRYVGEAVPFQGTAPIKTVQKAGEILKSAADKDLPFCAPIFEKWTMFIEKAIRHAPFSTKQEIALIEQKLTQQGVFARFGDDLELATVVESGLSKAKNAGFELPKYIIVNGIRKNELGSVPMFRKKNASEAPVFLSNSYIQKMTEGLEANKKAYAKNSINFTSTNNMDGTVCHEITHWLHFQNIPDKKTCEKIWKTVNEKIVVPEVSFSVLNDKAGKEFVAEVGAGLMDGKVYSDYVMDIYKQLKGPMPKSLSHDNPPLLNHLG